MKKDEQSLLRMNFLLQAARVYDQSFPEFSTHLLYDFVQMSEKKMIRIQKNLKKKIDKRRFKFRKQHFATYIKVDSKGNEKEEAIIEQEGCEQNMMQE